MSIHAFLYMEDTVKHEALKAAMFTYKHFLMADGDEPRREAFSVPVWCRLCAVILTDDDPPAPYKTWKEAMAAFK